MPIQDILGVFVNLILQVIGQILNATYLPALVGQLIITLQQFLGLLATLLIELFPPVP